MLCATQCAFRLVAIGQGTLGAGTASKLALNMLHMSLDILLAECLTLGAYPNPTMTLNGIINFSIMLLRYDYSSVDMIN